MSQACDEQLLSAYHDDELALSDRARVEAHLRECPACMRQMQMLREATRLFHDYPFEDITESELSDLHQYVDDAADRPVWRIGGTLGVVAASILVIGLAWLQAIPATAPRPNEGRVATAAPESWERVATNLKPDPVIVTPNNLQLQDQSELAFDMTDWHLKGLMQGGSR